MKMGQNHDMELETQAQLEKHEAECLLRYTYVQDKLCSLDKRLWRLEAMVMLNVVAVIGAVLAVLSQVN
jgi:hypothetical protein|tara:strand:+ start:447 stop:653 length:207 start_codon:yes stop_codon:yes gene_type:complete